jgi:N-acetylmuramoyl-L-alanine amidase
VKQIAKILRGQIERVQIYINTGRRSLAQIKAETGADYICNGGLFDGRFRAVCHLRADGYTWAEDEYSYHGYGWDTNYIRVMLSGKKDTVRNYICCVELIRDGAPIDKPIYNADLGGVRGRTALALTKDGDLLIWCSQDGTGDDRTPETLRDELFAMGAYSAIMLDGGGSSQCDFAGEQIKSDRIVHNLICVYLKQDTGEGPGETEGTMSEKKLVYLDPGHGGVENYNGSPDGTYKEHEFTLDMGNRIKAHLERCGVSVGMTRTEDVTVPLSERAAMANRAGADIFVSIHSNASGSNWSNASGLCAYTYAAGGTRDMLAKAILEQMRAAGVAIFSAGLYHSKFAVLAQTDMPACLVEYGFHTNKDDVARLKNDAWRESLAIATAKGICAALNVAWTAPKADSGKIYRVQVGAFTQEKNAVALKQELENKGYKPFIVKEVKA